MRQRYVVVSLFCGMVLACGAAGAQEPLVREVKVGFLNHDVDGLWSGFSRESGADINLEIVLGRGVELFGGKVRPALGGSVNTAGDTSKAYVDLRWDWDFKSNVFDGVFIGFGVGAAIHDGELGRTRGRKALGSRVLFHIPFEVGIRPYEHVTISLYFDHVSNAYLAEENEGMDTLGVRVGYRF